MHDIDIVKVQIYKNEKNECKRCYYCTILRAQFFLLFYSMLDIFRKTYWCSYSLQTILQKCFRTKHAAKRSEHIEPYH